MSALPLPAPPITPLGPLSAATLPWRARGAVRLTLVLKATFTLVPEGRMILTEPDPIALGELPDPSGIGLRTAGDLAPYVGQPEIWLTGHAGVPQHFSQPCVHVQLAVVQAGVLRVDKQIDLDVSGGGPEQRTIPIVGLGPIARDWPLRSRWLEGLDGRGLDAPLLDIPDSLHWEYFQTAPLDQRLDPLRGDEWLVLGGMVLRRPRLRTQLPAASGMARIYRKSQASPRAGELMPLRAEAIQVDVDRQVCSILWRGHLPLDGEGALASLRIVAGLDRPGQAIPWADPFPREEAAPLLATRGKQVSEIPFSGTIGLPVDLSERLGELPALPFEAPATETPFAGTMAIPVDLEQRLAAKPTTPFKPAGGAQAEGPIPFSGTMAIPSDMAERLAAALVTPFDKAKAKPAPLPPKGLSAVESPFSGTMAIPVDLEQRLAVKSATPFKPAGEAQAEGPVPFSGTMAIPSDLAERLAAALATPFDKASAKPAPLPPKGFSAVESPFSGTMAIPEDLAEKLAAAAATPFEKRGEEEESATERLGEAGVEEVVHSLREPEEPPALPIEVARPTVLFALDEADFVGDGEGLGAEFLAAMAAAGEPV